MPNHVTTVCTITGPDSDIGACIARHIVEEKGKQFLDFRTIIPMPAVVAGTESGSEADAGFYALTGLIHSTFGWGLHNPMEHYVELGFRPTPMATHGDFAAWLEAHEPTVLEKGRKVLQCFRETGHRDWYGWSIANWGTKWNSYGYKERSREPGRFVFEFETAWSVPTPVLDKLAVLWPELTFDTESIDEGGPEYVGHFRYGAERRLDKVPSSVECYERVYGRKPETDEEA